MTEITSSLYPNTISSPGDMLYRQFQTNFIPETPRDFFDVFEGSAFDDAPLWTVIHAQHAVVFKKPDEIARRKGIHAALAG